MAKMSTEKVIVMILHAVQNRIHVSVPVAVHVERTCSEYMYMCARGLYPGLPMEAGLSTRLSVSRHVTFHHRCIQSNVVMP